MPTDTYLDDDVLQRADALNFSNKRSQDVWSLGFGQKVKDAVSGLESFLQPTQQPQPEQASPIEVTPKSRPSLTEQVQQTAQTLISQLPSAPPWRQQPVQDTSGVDASGGPSPAAGSAVSSSPAGASPPSAGAQPAAMPTGGGGAFRDNNERLAYVRQSAIAHGHDPDVAARVAMSEGAGPAGSVGDNGTSFGALQAHVGGGQGDDFRTQTGLDPSDPNNERALIDWQLSNLSQTGWSPFHGAAAAGIGDRQGIGTGRVSQTTAPSPVAEAQPTAMPQGQVTQSATGNLRPSQFDKELTREEAISACGIVGAVGFAAATGHYPTVKQSEQIAQNANLWGPDTGMHGPASEVELLRQMGVAAKMTPGVNWNQVRAQAQSGNPVMFDTDAGSAGHYYFIEGARQRSDGQWEYDLGTSATDLRASGGKRWYTESEIPALGFGNPANTIYLDDPATRKPSPVAGKSQSGVAENPTAQTIVASAAPVTQAQDTGGPPWQTPTPTETAATQAPSQSTSAAEDSSGSTATTAPLMLRQALNQQTSGPDSVPTWQDSQTEPASPISPPTSGVGSAPTIPSPTDASASVSDASAPGPGVPPTPAPQVIPNEDATSYGPAPQPSGQPGIVDTSGPEQGPQQPSPSIVQRIQDAGGAAKAGLTPVLDAGGKVIAWVHDATEKADEVFNRPATVTDPAQREWIAGTGMNPDDLKPGGLPGALERTVRDAPQNIASLPAAHQAAVDDVAQSIIEEARATGQSVSRGEIMPAIGHGLLTGLDVANIPFEIGQRDIDALLPEFVDPATGFSAGTIAANASLPRDAVHIAQSIATNAGRLAAAGVKVTPRVVSALKGGLPVEEILQRAAGVARESAGAPERAMANALEDGATIGHGGAPMETKQPWQMTQDEVKQWVDSQSGVKIEDAAPVPHKVIETPEQLQEAYAYYQQQGIPVFQRSTGNIQGDIKRGYSTNYQTGQREGGISANEIDPIAVPTRGDLVRAVGAQDFYNHNAFGGDGAKHYLITGEEAGRGGDNEPVLRASTIKVLAEVKPGPLTDMGALADDLRYRKKYPNAPMYSHRNLVSDALARGETVPPEVLAEWPELAKKYPEAYAPRGEPPGVAPSSTANAVPSEPTRFGPAMNAAALAAPGRTLAAMGPGAVAGGAAGYASSPEDASPEETAARTVLGAGGGALAATGIAGFGTLAAGRLVDSLVERGAINARVLATHPKTADRIRALFSVAADGLPDNHVVPVPDMVQAMVRMRPQIGDKVADLLSGPVTAGDVRRIVGDADAPGIGQTLTEMAVDALTGLQGRTRRGNELAADAATVRGLSEEARRATTGRAASTLPVLSTPNGPARLVDPEASPNLTNFVNGVADDLGVARPGVYLSPSPVVNAAATTDGKAPALILTRGLLNADLTDNEMAAVLTHELAHTAQDSRSLVGRAFGAMRDALSPGERETAGALPGGGQPPQNPQATVQAAQQVAQNPQSPPNAQRLAAGIQRAAQRGVPPALPNQVPGFPAPPPKAPPTFNDAVQAWRYSMGLFGSISTGLLQTMGGAAEVALGAPAEIIRQAVLRGHPEHVPLIIGEALKSVPSGFRSFGETAAGRIPPVVKSSPDYRPPLSDKLSGPARAAALVVETPGRVATQAPDALWYEIYYRTGLAQAAAEEAQKTAGRMNPAASWQAQQQLIANPTAEMIDRAHEFAQNSTYKGELGSVAKAIGTIFRGPDNPTSGLGRAWKEVGSYIMPVYHTIARIHEGSLEYAPGVGMLPLNRLGLAAKGRSTDTKIAQQIVGLGLTAGILGYASEGGIRGPGPSDPDKLKEMIDQGYTPNTTNIGGIWVRNSDLGKAGPLINMVGAYNDAVTYGNGKEQFDAQRWDQRTKALVDGFARSLSDYPAAQAFSTILKARTDPVGALTELGAGAASQFVPAAYRTYAGAVDPSARTTNRGPDVSPEQRFSETFEQRSGVGRQSLPVSQNRLGEDQPNARRGWNVLLPRVGQDRPNAVEQTFLDNGIDLGRPPGTVSYTPKGGRNKGVETAPVSLNPDEQRKWNTYRGEVVKDELARTTQSAFWQRAGREDKQDELKAILAAANKTASERVIDDMGKDYDRRLDEAIGAQRGQRGLAPAGR